MVVVVREEDEATKMKLRYEWQSNPDGGVGGTLEARSPCIFGGGLCTHFAAHPCLLKANPQLHRTTTIRLEDEDH